LTGERSTPHMAAHRGIRILDQLLRHCEGVAFPPWHESLLSPIVDLPRGSHPRVLWYAARNPVRIGLSSILLFVYDPLRNPSHHDAPPQPTGANHTSERRLQLAMSILPLSFWTGWQFVLSSLIDIIPGRLTSAPAQGTSEAINWTNPSTILAMALIITGLALAGALQIGLVQYLRSQHRPLIRITWSALIFAFAAGLFFKDSPLPQLSSLLAGSARSSSAALAIVLIVAYALIHLPYANITMNLFLRTLQLLAWLVTGIFINSTRAYRVIHTDDISAVISTPIKPVQPQDEEYSILDLGQPQLSALRSWADSAGTTLQRLLFPLPILIALAALISRVKPVARRIDPLVEAYLSALSEAFAGPPLLSDPAEYVQTILLIGSAFILLVGPLIAMWRATREFALIGLVSQVLDVAQLHGEAEPREQYPPSTLETRRLLAALGLLISAAVLIMVKRLRQDWFK